MPKKSIADVASKEVPVDTKIKFFEREKRAGKQKVFRGLKQIKKDIGKPSSMQGVIKVHEGNAQIRFADKNLAVLKFKKKKKYWK